jgi:hypothetical protein
MSKGVLVDRYDHKINFRRRKHVEIIELIKKNQIPTFKFEYIHVNRFEIQNFKLTDSKIQ